MSTNEELASVRALLVEASTEIPAKIDLLLAQVGDQADPALVADIKSLATGLANIVPNPEPEAPAEPETPVSDEG